MGPAIVSAVLIGAANEKYARMGREGLMLGLIAVLIYDLTCRVPFILCGLWPDFIPKIGNYLLNEKGEHWFIGYLWRYFGNGGGMGLAFYMGFPLLNGRYDARRCGPIYGLAIFCCLLATLYLSRGGTTYLFKPNLMSSTAR